MEHKRSTDLGGQAQVIENMERETGIEPATNSLEGCDSTTELLPLAFRINRLQELAGDIGSNSSIYYSIIRGRPLADSLPAALQGRFSVDVLVKRMAPSAVLESRGRRPIRAISCCVFGASPGT